MRIPILIGLLLIMPTIAAQDTVYQWVDENGNISYSDKPPPPGTQVTEKELEPIPDVGTVNPTSSSSLPESEEAPTIAEKLEQEETQLIQRRLDAASLEELIEIDCGVARDVIDNLSSGRDVSVAGTDGTIRIMSDAERQDRIRVSQKYFDEKCK